MSPACVHSARLEPRPVPASTSDLESLASPPNGWELCLFFVSLPDIFPSALRSGCNYARYVATFCAVIVAVIFSFEWLRDFKEQDVAKLFRRVFSYDKIPK